MDKIEEQRQRVLAELHILQDLVAAEFKHFDWWKFPAGVDLISARCALEAVRRKLKEVSFEAIQQIKEMKRH